MSFYRVIDISNKKFSLRKACVFGSIIVGQHVISCIKNNNIEKGNPIILAEIAGINAVKNTPNFIILCHNINIENVFFHIEINEKNFSIDVYSFVFANSKTGVEMEAICGVSAALLTIYDLTKKISPFSFINIVKLLYKEGGETGVLGNINDVPDVFRKHFFLNESYFDNFSFFIITISDRASLGRYFDLSGKLLLDFFLKNRVNSITSILVPDDDIILFNILKNYIDIYSPNVVITTGGTGISSRDITFDIIIKLCKTIIPGIGELLRINNSYYSSNSWLSRSVAGVYNNTLIVSLPGKPNAITESLSCLGSLIKHSVKIINEL